jgi:hypothetical protein
MNNRRRFRIKLTDIAAVAMSIAFPLASLPIAALKLINREILGAYILLFFLLLSSYLWPPFGDLFRLRQSFYGQVDLKDGAQLDYIYTYFEFLVNYLGLDFYIIRLLSTLLIYSALLKSFFFVTRNKVLYLRFFIFVVLILPYIFHFGFWTG